MIKNACLSDPGTTAHTLTTVHKYVIKPYETISFSDMVQGLGKVDDPGHETISPSQYMSMDDHISNDFGIPFSWHGELPPNYPLVI